MPIVWKYFLRDQRGERRLQGVLSDRLLSLRSAANREREEQEKREVIRYKAEELERKKRQEEEKNVKSIDDIEQQVPTLNSLEDEENVEDVNDEEGEEDDSNWEDCEDKDTTTKSKPSKYNTIALKNFIRECERYGLSDRGAAKVANGLLRDLKIVKKGETSNLICPSKVYRERIKWGNKLAKEKLQTQFPPGLYTDGKRVPTLRRETSYTKVGKSLINTSLAAKGALANRLQNPKWPLGGPKMAEGLWKGVYP